LARENCVSAHMRLCRFSLRSFLTNGRHPGTQVSDFPTYQELAILAHRLRL
jgi:hypothetical protein